MIAYFIAAFFNSKTKSDGFISFIEELNATTLAEPHYYYINNMWKYFFYSRKSIDKKIYFI